MSYSPFPEHELEALALENDAAAKQFRNSPRFFQLYTDRAAMLRNANVCHEALRERALLAECARDQALNALDRIRTHPINSSTTITLGGGPA